MVVAGQYGVIMRVMIPGRTLFPLTSGSTSGFVQPIVDIMTVFCLVILKVQKISVLGKVHISI